MSAIEYDVSSGNNHVTQPVSRDYPLPIAESAVTIVTNQSVSYTGTAGTSAAVNASTAEVTVMLTTDGYIAVGSNPTATTSDHFLRAYERSRPIKVTGGSTKISAIRDTNSGTMKVAEYSR